MRWFNHIVTGGVITGTFIALTTGQNILNTITNIICVVFFSLLPDIDLPVSPISKLTLNWVFKHSNWIATKWGHRTYTHSIWALILVVIVTWTLGRIGLGISPAICGLAFFIHIFLDMMTVTGVPFLYPIKKKWVFPGNKRFRFNTDNTGSEVMILGVSVMLYFFMTPLFENGFWTVYNKSFGTPKTMFSEKLKSQDLLLVNWRIFEGSITKEGTGYLVDMEDEDKFTLLDLKDSLIHFNAKTQIIKEVKFEHTNRKYFYEKATFINISADSLNKMISGKIVINIDAHSTESFMVLDNGIPYKLTSAKLHFPNKLYFQSLDSLPFKDSLFTDTDFESMRIRNELQKIENEYSFKQSEYNRHHDSLDLYSELARNEKEEIKKERLIKRRDEIHLPDRPQKDMVNEAYLRNALVIAEKRFEVEKERRRFERERSFMDKVRLHKATAFVGVFEAVRIE
ncbi:MAG: hypothetical protein RLZZ292_2958 [Bacteroidota bacterium]|jgi:membrane-bound metal-dependent hydrolase YbcI (DUF457 family)